MSIQRTHDGHYSAWRLDLANAFARAGAFEPEGHTGNRSTAGWSQALLPDRYSSKSVAKNRSLCLNPAVNSVAAILKRLLAVTAGVACLLALFLPPTFAATGPTVSLVISDDAAKPVQHGLGKLRRALQAKGVSVEEAASLQRANGKAVVVAGLAASAGEPARLLAELKLSPSRRPSRC